MPDHNWDSMYSDEVKKILVDCQSQMDKNKSQSDYEAFFRAIGEVVNKFVFNPMYRPHPLLLAMERHFRASINGYNQAQQLIKERSNKA